MKTFGKVTTVFLLGLVLQGGVYYYLDQVYLAPTTNFQVTNGEEVDKNFPDVKEGTRYYSHDHKYMAVVEQNRVDIYTAGKEAPVTLDLKEREVSYFEWMSDRNLAIVGLFGGKHDDIVLARITDVAYSAATNVVYMKVRVGDGAYRVYRTDANYDTRRVYMQASDIGRIGMFYNEDRFFYDNARTGDVFMFNGTEGGWRAINPPGKFRLIGVTQGQLIYIVKVDDKNRALEAYEGKLGVGFNKIYTYDNPTELTEITVDSILKDKESAKDSASTEKKK